jgi:uncharacterized protein YlbG (UPF0298 family)
MYNKLNKLIREVMIMDLCLSVEKSFLDLFYNDIKNLKLDNSDTLINLFILNIENKQFTYPNLLDELRNSVVTYALSQKEIKDLGNKYGTIYTRAVDRLRKYNSNEGELGELLLYSFLESHLKAPKILTKLRLKTSSNDYVKGSDGIHILKLDQKNYQLIFGESKVYSDFKEGLDDAFTSIHDFVNRDTNNINDEINLLSTHLKEEVIDENLYEFLKKVIIPSAADEEVYKDNAFGVFVGFNIDISDEFKKLSNDKFRSKIRTTIIDKVKGELDFIQQEIDNYELQGYSFYIYTLPFTKLSETRKKFIKNLKEVKNDF